MYEITHGGVWFQWGLLDRTGKWLAGSSLVTAAVALAPAVSNTVELLLHLAEVRPAEVAGLPFTPFAAPWLVAFGAVSALLWWRFSRRQDELFNRVQNYALALAGAWSATLLVLWQLLSRGGLLPAVDSGTISITFCLLIGFFWSKAVRRWV